MISRKRQISTNAKTSAVSTEALKKCGLKFFLWMILQKPKFMSSQKTKISNPISNAFTLR